MQLLKRALVCLLLTTGVAFAQAPQASGNVATSNSGAARAAQDAGSGQGRDIR